MSADPTLGSSQRRLAAPRRSALACAPFATQLAPSCELRAGWTTAGGFRSVRRLPGRDGVVLRLSPPPDATSGDPGEDDASAASAGEAEAGPADVGRSIGVEWMERAAGAGRSFMIGAHYAVAYRAGGGDWDLDAAETPDVVKRRAAASLRALAHAERVIELAEPESWSAPDIPAVPLSAESLAAALAPSLMIGSCVGGSSGAAWELVDIHPSSSGGVGLLFAAGPSAGARELRLVVRARADVGAGDSGASAGHHSKSLDVTYSRAFGQATRSDRTEALQELAEEVALLLDDVDREVRFVSAGEPERPDVARVGGLAPTTLNLAIPADCGQACSFCSVREELGATLDAQPAIVRSLREDIRRAAGRGARTLRVNGIEPLNAPYIFELLELARSVGFEEVHTHSTCRPLADPSFAARYVAAMPARWRAYVPLYGSTAAIHDGVTGAPGAYDDVLRAVANLQGLMAQGSDAGDDTAHGGEIVVTTVLMRANVGDLAALRDLVRPLCRWWEVHLPFPNTSSVRDRYRDVAVSMTEALQAAYPAGWWPVAELPLGEIVPCVALAHQEATGHALVTADRIGRRMREPAGTFYRTAGFEHSLGAGRADALVAPTTPCPHQQACALASACPKAVYTLYAAQFGLDELSPVTADDLTRLGIEGGSARDAASGSTTGLGNSPG